MYTVPLSSACCRSRVSLTSAPIASSACPSGDWPWCVCVFVTPHSRMHTTLEHRSTDAQAGGRRHTSYIRIVHNASGVGLRTCTCVSAHGPGGAPISPSRSLARSRSLRDRRPFQRQTAGSRPGTRPASCPGSERIKRPVTTERLISWCVRASGARAWTIARDVSTT